MENILITGAAGFIGSHLVDKLLHKGFRIFGVDDLSLGKLSNLSLASSNPNFQFYKQDINHPAFLDLFQGEKIRAIWHLAANSDISAGVKDWKIDHEKTFLTTLHALNLAEKLSIPEFLFASSSAVYGVHEKQLEEDTGPLFPISSYGAMKLASEGILSTAVEKFLKSGWIFRFPNVVGPRATHGVIYDLFHKLAKDSSRLEVLGNGLQRKPYLHVSELVDAMIFCWEQARDRINYFNLGVNGSATEVRYIAETVVQTAGGKAKIEYTGGEKGWVGDIPRFSYSTKKVENLGWKAKMTSDQAIDRAVQEIGREIL